jgi:hypothetical protein
MDDDRAAIAALVYAYATHLDAGDFDGVAALFERATLRSDRHPVVRRGRADALALYRDVVVLYDGVPYTQHVITNLAITLSPARREATSRCAFTVLQAHPQLPLQAILCGRYHDRFAMHDAAGWHFIDRLICVDLVGDLRFHNRKRG